MRMRTVVVFCIIIPALLACVDKDKKQGQDQQQQFKAVPKDNQEKTTKAEQQQFKKVKKEEQE